MRPLSCGHFGARLAASSADLQAAQKLRNLAFGSGRNGLDADAFDAACLHVLIEDRRNNKLVCCFRLMLLANGTQICASYSAQFYELSALRDFDGPMLEMGRFCIHPDCHDPDVLRVAWGALSRFVDEAGTKLLFGCSSFNGTGAEAYLDAFALLAHRHLAPKCWLPGVKAPAVFRFAGNLQAGQPDMRAAMRAMPPLLRSYLAMGGWVSDHAVVDRDLGTLHVFTGLEVGAIPIVRARLMRAVGQ